MAENGHVRIERYARLEPLGPESEGDWLAIVRERVEAAVRRRLISDVPLGALLSGGIDSSIVVSLMAQASTHPCAPLLSPSATSVTTSVATRAVAERFATEHEEIRSKATWRMHCRASRSRSTSRSETTRRCRSLVCEAARQHVTVALTGDGGDESFAGYERYVAHELAGKLHVPGVGAAARALRSMGRAPVDSRSRGPLPAAASQPGERYGGLMEVFPAEARVEPRRRVRSPSRPGLAARPAARRRHRRAPAPRHPDIPSRRSPAEGRYRVHGPLARAALAVPRLGGARARRLAAARAEGERQARKEALRAFADDLPDDITERGKSGFGVPLADWFRTACATSPSTCCSTLARAIAGSCGHAPSSACSVTTTAAPTTRTGCGACSCSSCGSGHLDT